MPELKDILAGLRSKHGTQVEVAEKLGISSQQLGQYESGKRNPKIRFYRKWNELFKQDLMAMLDEANDSRGTGKGTPAILTSNKTDTLKGGVYTDLIENNTEYRLIPKIVLTDYKIIPNTIIDGQHAEIKVRDNLIKKYEKLIESYEKEIARLSAQLQTKKAKN